VLSCAACWPCPAPVLPRSTALLSALDWPSLSFSPLWDGLLALPAALASANTWELSVPRAFELPSASAPSPSRPGTCRSLVAPWSRPRCCGRSPSSTARLQEGQRGGWVPGVLPALASMSRQGLHCWRRCHARWGASRPRTVA